MRPTSSTRGWRLATILLVAAVTQGLAWTVAAQEPSTSAAPSPATEPAALPSTVDAVFRRANELAFAEDYAAALDAYAALGDVGIADADVEQNMAVCHARLDDLPRAIFHFERAFQLRPGDEGIEAALAATEDALARARADEEGEAELERDTHFAGSLVRSLTERGLAISLLLGVACLCAATIARRRTRTEARRVGLTLLLLFLAMFVGVAASGLVAKQGWLRQGTPAVVLVDPLQLHQSPDDRSPVLTTPARGGERATVLDEYEGFVRLRLGARQGWARAEHVGRLR